MGPGNFKHARALFGLVIPVIDGNCNHVFSPIQINWELLVIEYWLIVSGVGAQQPTLRGG
jgi:hypothetical protein